MGHWKISKCQRACLDTYASKLFRMCLAAALQVNAAVFVAREATRQQREFTHPHSKWPTAVELKLESPRMLKGSRTANGRDGGSVGRTANVRSSTSEGVLERRRKSSVSQKKAVRARRSFAEVCQQLLVVNRSWGASVCACSVTGAERMGV